MLKPEEIKRFILEDATSTKKMHAKVGKRYFNGENDIKQYRLFYFDADGVLQEDKTRTNIKIAHNFHRELCIQLSQYILSGSEGIVTSTIPELQDKMDEYFNNNEEFMAELSETITGCASEGSCYMFAYVNDDSKTAFQHAGFINVVEVREKDTDDGCKYYIYWYVDRIEKGQKQIKRIQVHDDTHIYFYVQDGEGDVELDSSEPINPRPHTLYYEEGKDKLYYEPTKRQTFFRLDNNEEQMSDLRLYKDQVDDYDIHASSLTNNLVDFDTPLHVVKGFQGDDLTQLQQNLKTKKIIGVDDNGGVEVHTVEIPYQARLAKLELDEKAIYRSGMGLNTAGLKDTNATTNMAIKSAYSLLDMKAKELEKRIKRFMRGVIRVVLDEINAEQGTDFQLKDVKVEFKHEIMTNELENAQIKQVEAQEQNMRLASIMNVATVLDKETVQQQVCSVLELDYEEIKGKLPDPEEAETAVKDAQGAIDSVVVEDEQATEGNLAITT